MVTARPSRSAEEMSGLIALQSLRSQGQIPSPERYQLNVGEMSPTGIGQSEWEDAMMAYEEVKIQEVEAVHGPNWTQEQFDQMRNQ